MNVVVSNAVTWVLLGVSIAIALAVAFVGYVYSVTRSFAAHRATIERLLANGRRRTAGQMRATLARERGWLYTRCVLPIWFDATLLMLHQSGAVHVERVPHGHGWSLDLYVLGPAPGTRSKGEADGHARTGTRPG